MVSTKSAEIQNILGSNRKKTCFSLKQMLEADWSKFTKPPFDWLKLFPFPIVRFDFSPQKFSKVLNRM